VYIAEGNAAGDHPGRDLISRLDGGVCPFVSAANVARAIVVLNINMRMVEVEMKNKFINLCVLSVRFCVGNASLCFNINMWTKMDQNGPKCVNWRMFECVVW
jgi:hypothetical protein